MTMRSKSDWIMARWVPIYLTSSSELYVLLRALTYLSRLRSSLLVDSNRTLHARLTQSTVPALVTNTSSAASFLSLEPQSPVSPVSTNSDVTYNPMKHHPPRPQHPPPSSPPPAAPRSAGSTPSGRKKKRRQNEVHVTLRRGGR